MKVPRGTRNRRSISQRPPVSPDGRIYAQGYYGYSDTGVYLWDIATGETIQHLDAGVQAFIDGFSSDSRLLLTSTGSLAQLWDLQTGALLRTFNAHTATLWSTALSPDGHYVLTGSADNTVRIWAIDTDPAGGAAFQKEGLLSFMY